MCPIGFLKKGDLELIAKKIQNYLDTTHGMNSKVEFNHINWETTISFRGVNYVNGKEEEVVFYFDLSNFPQTDFVISNYMHVEEKYRGLGIAQFLAGIKEEICRLVDVSVMVCTVNSNNKVQLHILEKTGWTKIGNLAINVEIWSKAI